jgi:CheY-like chemotaxis protein
MTRTILLADDSVTIRKVVEITFGDTDIRVEAVGSGREALERLDTLQPDLVLADVVMPGPTGYELCERIKASNRPIPVLLLAGTFEPFDPLRARECGADGHLVKPFESRALVQRVEALLARGPSAPRPRPEPADDREIEAVFDDLAARDGEASDGPFEEAREEVPAGEAAAPWVGAAAEFEETASPEPETVSPPAPVVEIRERPQVPSWAREAVAVAAASPRLPFTPEEIDAVARAVVERLGGEALREVAWEVVPDLAEVLIRERLDEIEREERGRD